MKGHAVLVAASEGWKNYRHQADVLGMYQYLKEKGYDDDHIILIMADDLAYNEKNPLQGVVRREIVRVNSPLEYEILGQTIDDAVGEAFDKTNGSGNLYLNDMGEFYPSYHE